MLDRLVIDGYGLWAAWRGRRAAVRVLAPKVTASRARLGTIAEHVWRDPYTIGLLGMSITLIALRATRGRIRANLMGNVQVDAWRGITGYEDADIGEEILLLSTAGDARFKAGCRTAIRMFGLSGAGEQPLLLPGPFDGGAIAAGDQYQDGLGRAEMDEAWQAGFDDHVLRLRAEFE